MFAEYSDNGTKDHAEKTLLASLEELYVNGYSEKYELKDINIIVKSFVPKKKFGTALVALCFVNYEFPVIDSN